MVKMFGAGAEIFDKLEPEPEPKFLTSWSRSRAAQKWTGSATLFFTMSAMTRIHFSIVTKEYGDIQCWGS
jgi:hypothetical protein